ncbi:thioesterase [Aestuariicella hydrocarbonica]|uniref:Thioesterase n=1 Tax=Pseudomaricurvus hydrocarbonicus TaxID=1470433 RepID=A0A9E5MG04_9GAMM|nr:thioesterase family protein [Aestuariicella hydrocarbonica]NHO64071.1 thioesterase [Aestuariicella hydrocarbonica]
MARVQLELPEQFIYKTSMQIRYTDLNTGGHVGNDQMISLISSARYSFFQHLQVNLENIDNHRIVVTDLVTSYRAESFAEEVLHFELGFMDFNAYGGDIIFRVTKTDKTLVTLAKTGFVFINQAGKVSPIPQGFINLLPDNVKP